MFSIKILFYRLVFKKLTVFNRISLVVFSASVSGIDPFMRYLGRVGPKITRTPQAGSY